MTKRVGLVFSSLCQVQAAVKMCSSSKEGRIAILPNAVLSCSVVSPIPCILDRTPMSEGSKQNTAARLQHTAFRSTKPHE